MVVVAENKPKDIAAILARDGFSMTVLSLSGFPNTLWGSCWALKQLNDREMHGEQVVAATKAKNERLRILKFQRM